VTTQLEFQLRGNGASQCDRILDALQDARGDWVSMPELARVSGAYAVHSRVADLRARGFHVEHRSERGEDGRTIHSFYRLPTGDNE
jgi:biotin operon repressor